MDHAPTRLARIAALRRPALLVRAARIASRAYRRPRDLARILQAEPPDAPGPAAILLAEREAALDRLRRDGREGYQPSAHVAVLAALIAEAAAAQLR
jgi:hypothetical protein